MSALKLALYVIGSLTLVTGCWFAPGPPPDWPELDLEDEPDTAVTPPSWYKSAKEHNPWPLGPEPEYATAEWRHWCEVRYNSRDIVRWLEAPPTIDGRPDEAVWKDAAVKTTFIDPIRKEASPATTIYLGYDDNNLYLAARAEEPYPTRMRVAAKHQDGPVRLDDHIAFSLAPEWKTQAFSAYRFLVNPGGTVSDFLDARRYWDAGVEAAAVVGQESWSVEVAIPLKALGARADDLAGDVWACRFVRHRYAGGRHQVSSWTRILDAETGAGNWGHVIFKGVKTEDKQPAEPQSERAEKAHSAEEPTEKDGP